MPHDAEIHPVGTGAEYHPSLGQHNCEAWYWHEGYRTGRSVSIVLIFASPGRTLPAATLWPK